jgi:hypothetical protein
MSIWSELLFLHGHVTSVAGTGQRTERPSPREVAEEAERLREIIGCPSAGPRRPEGRGPVLGVKGLA